MSAELAKCRAHLTDESGRLVKDKDLKMLPEDFGQMKKGRRKANAVKARGGRQAAAVGEEDAAGKQLEGAGGGKAGENSAGNGERGLDSSAEVPVAANQSRRCR